MCSTITIRPKEWNVGGSRGASAATATAVTMAAAVVATETTAATLSDRLGRASRESNLLKGGSTCGEKDQGGGTAADITGGKTMEIRS